jgi:ferric-dicitrate binding protein FerR (iron transport regulator)
MKKKPTDDILRRYTLGECNEQECAMVEAWYSAFAIEQPLYFAADRTAQKRMWKNIRPNRRKLMYPIAAAAALITILSLSVWIFNLQKNSIERDFIGAAIKPGKEGATLTLADGRRISLGSLNTGKNIIDQGVSIIKNSTGSLSYSKANINAQGVNILSTKRGETYEVVLPDGSKVRLNAESKLTYNISFYDGTIRKVQLEGEGYFEVAKDKKHPFVVETSNQKVEVLGTHFNISTYPEDHLDKTTLLEGSVAVSALGQHFKNIQTKKLIPGEQAMVSDKDISVNTVVASDAVDWINGKFICDNMPITELLNKIGRWYDVQFSVYKGDTIFESFSGTLSRTENIDVLLKRISLTGVVKFEAKGRNIVVYKQ